MQTKGQLELAERVKNYEGGQSGIARALGLNPSSVSYWARGLSRPEPHHREALRILLGILEDSWRTEEERASVDRVRAATGDGEAA